MKIIDIETLDETTVSDAPAAVTTLVNTFKESALKL